MIKKTPLTWLIAGLLIAALAIIMSGCSTEKPWGTNPSRPLVLTVVSGPGSADTIGIGAPVGFSWVAKGGTGDAQYQYRVDSGAYTALSRITSISLTDLTAGSHTVTVRAEDTAANVDTTSRTFHIAADTQAPFVWITEAPTAGTSAAVGSVLVFSWAGYDSLGNRNNIKFYYDFNGTVSDTTIDRTVTFANVSAADPAIFKVWAVDLTGNVSTHPDSVVFVIKTASILYIDDYRWLDNYGNINRLKEREQKAFYASTLQGYAFAEWDNNVSGTPTAGNVAGYTTILWAADSDVGSADPDYRLWYDVGALGGGVLKTFIDGGGKLILTGSEALAYVFNTNPPVAGDFDAAYLGTSDTLIIASIDTTVTPWDTTYAETWVHSTDFTWAIKASAATGYPDSMKIDVGKNGNQLANCASLVYIKAGVTRIFNVGLDVDGAEPDNYGAACAWTYAPGGNYRSAIISFDTFSMGEPAMRQTFGRILTLFGEH